MRESPMLEALHAAGPAADRQAGLALYGWLVGSWDVDVHDRGKDGSIQTFRGEWLFDWVLEGRAIQDVFVVPPRAARPPDPTQAAADRYGTTLRIYDPGADCWTIIWINPVRQAMDRMVGGREGDEIVQHGQEPDGTRYRWVFSDISDDRFRWRAENQMADGGWRLVVEFHATRRSA